MAATSAVPLFNPHGSNLCRALPSSPSPLPLPCASPTAVRFSHCRAFTAEPSTAVPLLLSPPPYRAQPIPAMTTTLPSSTRPSQPSRCCPLLLSSSLPPTCCPRSATSSSLNRSPSPSLSNLRLSQSQPPTCHLFYPSPHLSPPLLLSSQPPHSLPSSLPTLPHHRHLPTILLFHSLPSLSL
ncbi:hypothetical protein AMTR_s00004p00247480 [Amborella trichopoda]|uniref:Uncharacterized protein n=1 Tax=Amborella trichopoda TaxID=13333 RepID=W1NED6_AMBTC|nr:hypothetical protein AMTR_s00004p00247480 [Amborella trichopoda]